MSGNNGNRGASSPLTTLQQQIATAIFNYFLLVQAFVPDLPDLEVACPDFNSVPFARPPFRDVPSIILTHLWKPDHTVAEPVWNTLLQYFMTPPARHGLANLQDLFVFIVRVVLPNVIITNRRRLSQYYNNSPNASGSTGFRYDHWDRTEQAKAGLAAIRVTAPLQIEDVRGTYLPLDHTESIANRSIFRNRLTPNGTDFTNWLNTSIPEMRRLDHTPGEIDNYLTLSESTVRGWNMEELMRHTIRALNMFWYVSRCNSRF